MLTLCSLPADYLHRPVIAALARCVVPALCCLSRLLSARALLCCYAHLPLPRCSRRSTAIARAVIIRPLPPRRRPPMLPAPLGLAFRSASLGDHSQPPNPSSTTPRPTPSRP